jgi:hypothetical protein
VNFESELRPVAEVWVYFDAQHQVLINPRFTSALIVFTVDLAQDLTPLGHGPFFCKDDITEQRSRNSDR